MKKLFTYLLVLTVALLAIPNSARAQAMYLHFYGGYDGGGSDVNMPSGTASDTWAYTFYTSDCTSQTVSLVPKLDLDGVRWLKAYGTEKYSGLTNGESVICYAENADNKYDVSITLPADWNTKNYAVTITATNLDKTGYGATFTVTWTQAPYVEKAITLRTDAYKRDNNVDWIGIRYNEFDSENNVYTWYLNTIDGFTASSHFKLELNNTWYGNGETVGSTFVTLGSGDNNCIPTIPTLANGQVARLEARKVGGNWEARIVAGDGAHDYYWVSPQITNGEKWPAFRMVPSRNRYYTGDSEKPIISDGLMSTKYYTFTIKDDDLVTWKSKSAIGTGTQIQWYILRDDDVVVYRPTTDLAAGYKPHNNNPYDTNHPISGQLDSYVSFINFWNGSNYDGDKAYKTSSAPYNIGSWSFSKGSAKAHTFNLNVDRGHVLYNYTTTGTSDANGYKLAGNWSAGREVPIDISQAKPMTAYYYKNGKVITSDVAQSDSIVYKVSVDRPTTGWGGLYLDVLPASNADWDHAIRPLITLGNSLDGRALHGAMTTKSSDQSLNPEASPNYLGYTFSFNATTMTYRLEFHTPDATLSPGTEDGNVDFYSTTSEDITVELSDDSDDIHTTATQYAIGFADNTYFTLDETTKYSAATFNLTYDGETDRITYTSADNSYTNTVAGNTIFVKVRGFDANGDYGDIHTYQYTFHSRIGFEPQGGLFINSAKITITGGTAPYTYQVMNYPTKEENGELVIDFDHGTEITSGSFTSKTDELNRISTPGFLKITDAHNNTVVAAEVGGGFDFTYSTSENYNAATNGADYRRVMPSDLTWRLSPTWLDSPDKTHESYIEGQKLWNGETGTCVYLGPGVKIYQTVSGLAAGTYTVQALVSGGAVPIHLELNDTEVGKVMLTGEGTGSVASINLFGRCEHLENMKESTSDRAWHKLEGSATVSAGGDLKIAIRAEGGACLADVILLKDANTDGNYWTTAPTSEDVTECNMSDRSKYNAFSFFDRGANLNSIIQANQKTVIGMSEDNEPYLTGAEKGARRHPCNVVTSSDGGTTWHTPMLALTDYASVIVGSENKYGGNPKVSQHAYGTTFDYTADKFSYDRATSAKMMSTMLPFPLSNDQVKSMLGSGVKTYTLTGVDKTNLKVTFNETTNNLAAHTPFFFLPSEAKSKMALDEGVSVAATSGTSFRSSPAQGLLGTYKHISNVGTTYKNQNFIPYFFQNGSFVWAEDAARAKPFRVIFLLNKGNEARMLNAIFIDDTITGIDGITENIQQNAPVYSIDGKLVSSDGDTSRLSKGVYVKAGKKFIIK